MAFDFTAASSQNLTSTSTDITGYGSGFTVHLWCYPEDNSTEHGYMVVLTDPIAIPSRVAFNPYLDGRFYMGTRGASASSWVSVPYTGATWLSVTGEYASATDRTLHVNGSTITDTTASGAMTLTEFMIGSRRHESGTGYQRYADNVQIAEVTIWNVADLTDDEILALDDGFSGRLIRPDSIVFHQDLIRDLNVRNTGVTLTNNNAAPVADHPHITYPTPAYTFNVPPGSVGAGPVVTVPVSQTSNYGVNKPISGISAADADTNIDEWQLSCSDGMTMSVTTSGDVTVTAGANDSAAMTLGGTQADLNTVMGTFSVDLVDPGLSTWDTNATITIVVRDDTELSGSATLDVMWTPVCGIGQSAIKITGTAQQIIAVFTAGIGITPTAQGTIDLSMYSKTSTPLTDSDTTTLTVLSPDVYSTPGTGIYLKDNIRIVDEDFGVLIQGEEFTARMRDLKPGSITKRYP